MTAPRSRRTLWLTAGLLVAALAFATTGLLLTLRAHSIDSRSARDDRAVIDTAANHELVSQVSTGLAQVLSYDYSKPQVAQQAAQRWLTGDAPAQYRLLFSQLATLSKGQNLTLSARVVSIGVESLEGDHARLLVFVDQQSTRANDHQSTVSAAQVQISAVRTRRGWAISELKPL